MLTPPFKPNIKSSVFMFCFNQSRLHILAALLVAKSYLQLSIKISKNMSKSSCNNEYYLELLRLAYLCTRWFEKHVHAKITELVIQARECRRVSLHLHRTS